MNDDLSNSFSSSFSSQVSAEDLRSASELLIKALLIRHKYMRMTKQAFPLITSRFLGRWLKNGFVTADDGLYWLDQSLKIEGRTVGNHGDR